MLAAQVLKKTNKMQANAAQVMAMYLTPTLADMSDREKAFLAMTVAAVEKEAKPAVKNKAIETKTMTTLSMTVKQRPSMSTKRAKAVKPRPTSKKAKANLDK